MQDLLHHQLIRRFGGVPRWLIEDIATATRDDLVSWGEHLLDAKTLEEFCIHLGIQAPPGVALKDPMGAFVIPEMTDLSEISAFLKANCLEVRKRMLRRQWVERFGQVPDRAIFKLIAATEEQIDRWARASENAMTLEEVFAR